MVYWQRPSATALRTWMALTISMLWAIGYVVGVLERDYTGVGVATPVALVAIGYLLGANFLDKRGNGGAAR